MQFHIAEEANGGTEIGDVTGMSVVGDKKVAKSSSVKARM
jgi:hypothetical protein